MSSITSVIVLGLYAGRKLGEINSYLCRNGHNDIKEINCCQCGGEKCMRPGILMGGFNYLNYGNFVKFLKSLDWGSEAQLLILEEHDERFRLINLSTNKISAFRYIM